MPVNYIAEVIESSTTQFAAQCRELHGAPPFGSFVKVEAPLTIIAQIYEITTGSAEAHRRPVAYGKTEAELRNEQPQIFELLRTEINAQIVGYIDAAGIQQRIPPQPPTLHSFVYPCSADEVGAFTRRFDYFRTLVGIGGNLSDELLIAAIQQTCAAQPDSARAGLIRVGKELARLLRDDYDRLESILHRVGI